MNNLNILGIPLYENGNHRQDQYTYICKKCGHMSCTYKSNRVGNVLYICPNCKAYNHIKDIKEQKCII